MAGGKIKRIFWKKNSDCGRVKPFTFNVLCGKFYPEYSELNQDENTEILDSRDDFGIEFLHPKQDKIIVIGNHLSRTYVIVLFKSNPNPMGIRDLRVSIQTLQILKKQVVEY